VAVLGGDQCPIMFLHRDLVALEFGTEILPPFLICYRGTHAAYGCNDVLCSDNCVSPIWCGCVGVSFPAVLLITSSNTIAY
jgi:hypothetical protein